MATAVRMMGEQYTGVKRSHYQMLDHVDTNLAFDGIPVQYHEMSRGGYYTPPPPGHQHTLYSNTPFPSSPATVQYIEDGGYLPSDNTMYTFTGTPVHQRSSFSEGFPSHVNESFGSTSSAASSCNVSLGPSTPPPQAFERNPMKFAPVPITPSSIQPRQKAKRTATVSSSRPTVPIRTFTDPFQQACEECRKRKQKCDGEAPCQSCKEQKLDCKYREVQPTK